MNYKHGHVIGIGRRSPTLITWHEMMRRCYNTKNHRYNRYGARGIYVCERWHNFNNFLEDMGVRPDGKTLDRINNDGPYEPENCKWSTLKEQARNRRTSKIIEYQGRSQSLAGWCEELGLNYIRTVGRINTCKWPIEKAFTYKT